MENFCQNNLLIWFEINGLALSEDFLIRCKHFESDKVRVPLFRIMANTVFTQGSVLRLLKKDVDFTSSIKVSNKFFIDLIFETEESYLAKKQQPKPDTASTAQDQQSLDQKPQQEQA